MESTERGKIYTIYIHTQDLENVAYTQRGAKKGTCKVKAQKENLFPKKTDMKGMREDERGNLKDVQLTKGPAIELRKQVVLRARLTMGSRRGRHRYRLVRYGLRKWRDCSW